MENGEASPLGIILFAYLCVFEPFRSAFAESGAWARGWGSWWGRTGQGTHVRAVLLCEAGRLLTDLGVKDGDVHGVSE